MKRNNDVHINDLVFCKGRICFVEKKVRGQVTKLLTSGFSYVKVDSAPIIYFKPTPVIANMYASHQDNLYKIFNHPKLREIAHCFNEHEVENKLENLWTDMCLAIGDDIKSYEATDSYEAFVREVLNCISEIAALKEKSLYRGVQIFK